MKPSYHYIYVWDIEEDRCIECYYEDNGKLKPEEIPITTHGPVPEDKVDELYKTLKRRYHSPRYLVDGGYSDDKDGIASARGLMRLADFEYDDSGEKRFLCVWNIKEQNLKEAYRIKQKKPIDDKLGSVDENGFTVIDQEFEEMFYRELQRKFVQNENKIAFFSARTRDELMDTLKSFYSLESRDQPAV